MTGKFFYYLSRNRAEYKLGLNYKVAANQYFFKPNQTVQIKQTTYSCYSAFSYLLSQRTVEDVYFNQKKKKKKNIQLNTEWDLHEN